MGLFNFGKTSPSPATPDPRQQIPINPIDLTKRYDVYCAVSNEERLYENVIFLGIRRFDGFGEFSSGLLGGYLEIESTDGARMLLPGYGIQLICEHGVKTNYKVLRTWVSTDQTS